MNYQSYPMGADIERARRTVQRLGRNYMSAGGVPNPASSVPVSPLAQPRQQYVDAGTGAGGREDNIDAKLSENEFVWDAETVALLGDGNPDKGAEKLEQMRQNVRRHKGQHLSKGKISPDAYASAEEYLSYGGGK